jgi:hypothetical protein
MAISLEMRIPPATTPDRPAVYKLVMPVCPRSRQKGILSNSCHDLTMSMNDIKLAIAGAKHSLTLWAKLKMILAPSALLP